jgi:hypothetical protein
MTKHWIRTGALFVLAGAVLVSAEAVAAERCTAAGKTRAVVALRQPESGDVAGVSLVLHYPKGRVAIPGDREDASVKARVRDLPSGFLTSINDTDDEIRVSLASGNATFAPDAHFTVEFDRCEGAQTVAASDFRCTVDSASLSCGSAIDDVSCVVNLE